jgi:hypothetical protein
MAWSCVESSCCNSDSPTKKAATLSVTSRTSRSVGVGIAGEPLSVFKGGAGLATGMFEDDAEVSLALSRDAASLACTGGGGDFLGTDGTCVEMVKRGQEIGVVREVSNGPT